MVLIVIFLFYNVYLFKLNRDADFQNVVSRSQQLDADRNSEIVSITRATCSGGAGGAIVINCTIVNSGSVPVQIVRAWLQDQTITTLSVANASLLTQNIVLQPGVTKTPTFSVVLPGASATHSFVLQLVTSRANVATTPVPTST
jgi:hypothetical protein